MSIGVPAVRVGQSEKLGEVRRGARAVVLAVVGQWVVLQAGVEEDLAVEIRGCVTRLGCVGQVVEPVLEAFYGSETKLLVSWAEEIGIKT